MNERVSQLRSKLGLTLKDFGGKIGMSAGGLADVERGRNPVQERHIKLILAAFPQVSEEWLRDGTGPMFTAPTEAEMRAQEYNFPSAVSEIFNRQIFFTLH